MALETGPDIPGGARRLLVYLPGLCHPLTGVVEVSQRSIARHYRRNASWPLLTIRDLETAGLVLVEKNPEGDGRRKFYTLAGVRLSWAAAVPRVPYSREGFYQLHRRIAELEGLLSDKPGGNPGVSSPTLEWAKTSK